MCCCEKPNINGQPGYSWDGKSSSTRPVNPPALADGEELIHDEPGRCGHGTDSHSHHFRLVKARYGGYSLLVRHGSGDQRVGLGYRRAIPDLAATLDSDARYWLFQALWHTVQDAEVAARAACTAMWRQAAADRRIKTRRLPARGTVKVWIADPPA
jgi:hypothetical protein